MTVKIWELTIVLICLQLTAIKQLEKITPECVGVIQQVLKITISFNKGISNKLWKSFNVSK